MPTSYRALPTLKIDGDTAPDDILENILQVVVEESLHRPSLFTLVIRNDYQSGVTQDDPWQRQQHFQIGQTIAIGFIPSLQESETQSKSNQKSSKEPDKGELIQGEITAIETQFSEQTQAPIIIRGYDRSHRLHRGVHNRSFQNMTDSDVVKKIAEEVSIETDQIDDSGEPHDYLFQENQSNMAFLRSRAARIGFELFVRDGKLNFRRPQANDDPLKLVWLQDVRSFHARVTSTEQVQSVEVRGWDYTTKTPIVSTAQREQLITETDQEKTGSETSTVFDGMHQPPKLIVCDRPMFKRKEADAMAQALCDELGGEFVVADARAEGNPDIRPGLQVELEEMGPYTGQYYITTVDEEDDWVLSGGQVLVMSSKDGVANVPVGAGAEPDPGADSPVRVVTVRTVEDERRGVLDDSPRVNFRSVLEDPSQTQEIHVWAVAPIVESRSSDEGEWRLTPIEATTFKLFQ